MRSMKFNNYLPVWLQVSDEKKYVRSGPGSEPKDTRRNARQPCRNMVDTIIDKGDQQSARLQKRQRADENVDT